jgi:hypothetical protein
MKRAALLYALAMFWSLAVYAQRACPWLTEGTAASALGGAVKASVQVEPDGRGTCSFLLEQAAGGLEISVGPARSDACGAASQKVSGIGNEAVECHSSPSPSEEIDVISSRVRATYFTVRLTVRGAGHSAKSEAREHDVLHDVAEQVAGALY